MKYLMISYCTILAAMLVLPACGYTDHKQNIAKPYTHGPTQGPLVRLPGVNTSHSRPLVSDISSSQTETSKNSTDDSKTQNLNNTNGGPTSSSQTSDLQAPKNSFSDLRVKIDIDPIELDGQKVNDAKIHVNLIGNYLVNGKAQKIGLKKTLFRFHPQTGIDILERSDKPNLQWGFSLANAQLNLAAQIYCLKSWSCQTVVVRMIWLEGRVRHSTKFYVKNTTQPTRLEPSAGELPSADRAELKDPSSAGETEHSHTASDDDEEASLHGEDLERGESAHFLYLPDEPEFFVNDDVTPKTTEEAANEDFLLKLYKDTETFNKTRLSSNAISIRRFENLNTSKLYFNFLGAPALGFYATETRTESMGSTNEGELLNGESLTPSYFYDQSPYVSRFGNNGKFYGNLSMVNLIRAVTEDLNTKFGRRGCVGNISKFGGGLVDPHKSHQNGLDADIYFYTQSKISQQKCSFDALDMPQEFDEERNWTFLKSLYQNAQAIIPSSGQRVSYLYKIFIHDLIKQRLCRYAKSVEGSAVSEKGSEAYEVLRRLAANKNHTNHFHVRLNCHQFACTDYGDPPPENNGCDNI